jgi:hypothetical protein
MLKALSKIRDFIWRPFDLKSRHSVDRVERSLRAKLIDEPNFHLLPYTNKKSWVFGMALLVFFIPLAVRGDNDGGKDEEKSSYSQLELRKLELSLAEKGRDAKNFQATKVFLNIANGKFVGGILFMNTVNGKTQYCEMVSFIANSDINAEISKNSEEFGNVLTALQQNKSGKVLYALEGNLQQGHLDTKIFDNKNHLVSLSSIDTKSGILIRDVEFDSEGNITGYSRYFGLDMQPKITFQCSWTNKIFHDYGYSDGKLSVEKLDEVLERIIDDAKEGHGENDHDKR